MKNLGIIIAKLSRLLSYHQKRYTGRHRYSSISRLLLFNPFSSLSWVSWGAARLRKDWDVIGSQEDVQLAMGGEVIVKLALTWLACAKNWASDC